MPRVRIAVASNRGGLDDMVAERFGRAPTFTIVEVEDGKIVNTTVIPNPGYSAASGAGVRAAEAVANAGARIYVGPQPGPNAYLALQHLGVKVYPLTGVKVREAVERVVKEFNL